MSNGGYLQSDKGIEARKAEIDHINQRFQEAIDNVMDPGKAEREQRALEENPLFAAGIRGLDRLRWDFQGAQQAARQLRSQGF